MTAALAKLHEQRWPPPPSARQLATVSSALISRTWTDGRATLAAENALCETTGAPYAVAFNSCTSAIHATLLANGLRRDSAVHTPAFGFAGTLTGASHIGVRLLYHDVDPGTGNGLNPLAAPGQLVLTPDLHGLPHTVEHDTLITDACQSLGTTIGGRHVHGTGTACWSFSSSKLVAAPDGGAVTTDDEALAGELRELRDYGAEPGVPRANALITRPGHNWRPSELSMALVAEQLRRLPETAARAHEIGETVRATLVDCGMWVQEAPDGVETAWHKLRTGYLPASARKRTRALQGALADAGMPMHRWGVLPLYAHPHFAVHDGQPDCPTTEVLTTNTFCLGTEQCPPWTWTANETDLVCRTLEMITETL